MRLSLWIFLFLFVVSLLMFPLLIPRKHIELKLAQAVPSFWFILGVVQMHNNIYEELGKLFGLLLTVWIFRSSFKPLLLNPQKAILLGFWGGLGYGVGEAITLTLISSEPALGRLAGIQLLWLFVTWNWVLERGLAIMIHGVLGGFVGLSLFYLLERKGILQAILFFFAALLYHELIDGTVIFIRYNLGNPFAKLLLNNLLTIVLPIYVFVGLVALAFVFFIKREKTLKEV